jgi:uncharacterized alpha-E superfamily protein
LFVGQEQVSFSTLPSFFDNHIEPRNAVLRTFITASGQDYTVMPGGLTRIASQKDNYVVSNQSGGISKDTWVLAAETGATAAAVSPQPKRQPMTDTSAEPLTSRAADNLFWVGRYIERIEAATRLSRTVLQKRRETFQYKDSTDQQTLKILLSALTQVTGSYPGFVDCEPQMLEFPDAELIAVAIDKTRKGSLAANILAFQQSAFNIRDFWSPDTWRCIDRIQYQWQQCVSTPNLSVEHLNNYLNDLITGLVAFTGLTSENMTREATWVMIDGGRRLERALVLITLLRATLVFQHDDTVQNQLLEAILVSTDSLTIYQRRYRSFIQFPRLLELLLLDETHPRSITYQLSQLSTHLSNLPRAAKNNQLCEEERLILKAYTDLRLGNVQELAQLSTNQYYYADLDQLLASSANLLGRLSEVISENYFSHSQTSQMVLLNTPEDEL